MFFLIFTSVSFSAIISLSLLRHTLHNITALWAEFNKGCWTHNQFTLTTIITTQGSVISTATHRTHHHHYHTRICDQYSYTQNSPPSLPHKDLWSVQLHTELTTIITTQGSVISTATHRTHHHHYHTRICDQYSYTQNSPPSLPHKDLWSVQLHTELEVGLLQLHGELKVNKKKKKKKTARRTARTQIFIHWIHCKLQYGCYLCWSAAGSFLLVSVFLPSPLSISNTWPWELPLKNMEHAISKQGQKWWHVTQWCRAPPTVAMRALRGYTVDWPHSLTALTTCTESTSAPPTLNGTIELSPPWLWETCLSWISNLYVNI